MNLSLFLVRGVWALLLKAYVMLVAMSPCKDILFIWVHELAMQFILVHPTQFIPVYESWKASPHVCAFSYLWYLGLILLLRMVCHESQQFHTFTWKRGKKKKKTCKKTHIIKIYSSNFMYMGCPMTMQNII